MWGRFKFWIVDGGYRIPTDLPVFIGLSKPGDPFDFETWTLILENHRVTTFANRCSARRFCLYYYHPSPQAVSHALLYLRAPSKSVQFLSENEIAYFASWPHVQFPPMPNQVAAAVVEYFAATRAMDADRWVATFAPNATSNDPVGAPPLVGHEALHAFISGIFSLFHTTGLTENSVFITGNTAAVKWTGSGNAKNGKSVSFEGIDIITVDDSGKISLVNAYWDPVPVMTAIQS